MFREPCGRPLVCERDAQKKVWERPDSHTGSTFFCLLSLQENVQEERKMCLLNRPVGIWGQPGVQFPVLVCVRNAFRAEAVVWELTSDTFAHAVSVLHGNSST